MRRFFVPAVAVAAALTFATSASVAVVRLGSDDGLPSAEAVLAAARGFVGANPTVRFEGDVRVESTVAFDEDREVPPEESGSFVSRGRVEGVASLPGKARQVYRADGATIETITSDDAEFFRSSGPDDEPLSGRKWVSVDDIELGFGDVGPEEPGFDRATRLGRIVNLADLLGRAVDATVTSRTGSGSTAVTVVRAGIDIRDDRVNGSLELVRGSMELDLGADGRPDRVLTELHLVDGERVELDSRLEYRLSAWGEPVDVSPPAPADVDPTPFVEEERVAAFREAPLLQPRGLPEGWVLDYADVLPAEDTIEGCDQVEIGYTDPNDEEAGYLTLFELPVACADAERPPGSQSFRAGANRGWVLDDGELGVSAQITVGRTVVQAETDLSPEGLAQVLGQLVPLDFDRDPVPLPGVRQRLPRV